MKKTIMAKIAAVCGAAALGISGFSAFAQTDRPVDERQDIVEGKTNIAAGIVRTDEGEKIKFPVYMVNNVPDGFTSLRVQLTYDQRLTPELDEEDTPVYKIGEAANDVSCKFTHDAESHTITMTAAGKTPEKDNGVLFTVELTVPQSYNGELSVTVKVDQFLDAKNQPIASEAVNGYIYGMGSPLLGDVNLDGEVTIEDSQEVYDYFLEHIADPGSAESRDLFYAGDVDKDGVLSIKDAENILIYYSENTLNKGTAEWGQIIAGEFDANAERHKKETGDLNYDKKIDAEDAQAALSYYVKKLADSDFNDRVDRSAGDIDRDKEITVEDAQYILQYYVTNTLAHNNKPWTEIINDPEAAQITTVLADRFDIVDGKMNIVSGIVKLTDGNTVDFPVYLVNNTGFSDAKINLIYDERLEPVFYQNGHLMMQIGKADDRYGCYYEHNAEQHTITLEPSLNNPKNGLFCTIRMKLPDDVKPGDKYPMTIETELVQDAKGEAVEHVTINGYIAVSELYDNS